MRGVRGVRGFRSERIPGNAEVLTPKKPFGTRAPAPPESTTYRRSHATRSQLPLLLALIALGLLSAALYYGALVRPYLLTQYVAEPLLDLGKIGGYDPEAGWRYTLPLLALWLMYLVAGALAPRLRGERALLALAFGGALGCGLILLWLYPITAADIFNYALYGLVQHRGGNPLVVPPDSVIGPPLIGYSAWPQHPSPYGPLWQGIAWLVTAVTGERLLAGIALFKAFLFACHLLNIALIARLAAASGVSRPGVAALRYAWNPLLLYETAGGGHNEIALLTGLLLALWALTTRRHALTLPLATLAALTKLTGALWLAPLALTWLPRAWRERRWTAPGWAFGGTLLLGVACYLPFWADGHALDGVRRQADLYTTSLAGLTLIANERYGFPFQPQQLLDLLKGLALAVVGLTILGDRPRDESAGEAARAAFDVSLAYLLVGALWFQPWYLVPLVGLAPLVGPARRAIAVCYALGATGSYVVYFYVWPALGWTSDRLLIQWWAVIVAHGPAWIALLAAAPVALWQRAARRGDRWRATGVDDGRAASTPRAIREAPIQSHAPE
ncbi:MAG TPA: hypothetical protein VIL85_05550 [Thermomicrobiales bacterium]|jgi:hypothetical protein